MGAVRRRTVGALSAALLATTGLAAAASPAAAKHIECGTVITRSVTLHDDVGPCTGDGLVVRAKSKNLVLDLNGHTVVGDHSAATATTPEHVGIRVVRSTGVTVRNGTVRGFEAGVALMGGGGNTVTGLEVHDNMNALRPYDPSNPEHVGCSVGDGITTFNSHGNTIAGNRVSNNGPFSGISLVQDSDGNVVRDNTVFNNNVSNVRPDGSTGPCGWPMTRARQDIGIRVEGPGAEGNVVQANQVTNNQLGGITIHGHLCNPTDESGNPLPPQPNTGNTIEANNVVANGFADTTESGDGIAVLQQGPEGVVCVAFGNSIIANTSNDNARDGVFLGGRGSHSNVIESNVVTRNGRDGIHVNSGAVRNTLTANKGSGNGVLSLAGFDGSDGNVNCDNNVWSANVFVTYNQPCVASP